MERVLTDETTVGDEAVSSADDAVISPTVDFLVLLSLTLVAAAALVVLL